MFRNYFGRRLNDARATRPWAARSGCSSASSAKALEPKKTPQTQACVDDQGNAIECVQPDDGPGSLQDQFVEKVATARRLKGWRASRRSLRMTQRKSAGVSAASGAAEAERRLP